VSPFALLNTGVVPLAFSGNEGIDGNARFEAALEPLVMGGGVTETCTSANASASAVSVMPNSAIRLRK
jgi:hypothetical protein